MKKTSYTYVLFFTLIFTVVCTVIVTASNFRQSYLPQIIQDSQVAEANYLPDFSYAGYHHGEKAIPDFAEAKTVNVKDYGAKADDDLDDSKAILAALEEANRVDGAVVLKFPPGKFIVSDILWIERSQILLRGAGSSEDGTTLYFPRPLMYQEDPEELAGTRKHLVEKNKRQREPENNIDLPYSQWSWSGGYIWSQVKEKGESAILAELVSGKQGEKILRSPDTSKLKVGDVVQLEWYNKDGEDGSLIDALYLNADLEIGENHWVEPDSTLVTQQSRIVEIKGNEIAIDDPLLLDIKPEWHNRMVEWKHLEEVAIEGFNLEFPIAPTIAHHVEEGYNALFLNDIYDGWVKDLRILNADSGMLTKNIANVTIEDVTTHGEKLAHYSVNLSGVHNVLMKNLDVQNAARHPLSFNSKTTKSVYSQSTVRVEPILDQHSAVNHQNLFDNVTVYIDGGGEKLKSYPLFKGGGPTYWKPTHAAYSTFWNTNVIFENIERTDRAIRLDGNNDGPGARVIGTHANAKIKVKYKPMAYIEGDNEEITSIPSLYQYQLEKRLGSLPEN